MRMIDADALKKFLNRQRENCHGYTGNKKEVYKEAILAVQSFLHNAPTVDAAPVLHGKWVWTERGEDESI